MLRRRLIGTFVVTALECPAVFAALWLALHDEYLLAIAVVAVGELLETGPLYLLARSKPQATYPEEYEDEVQAHRRRFQRQSATAVVGEFAVWLIWFAVAYRVNPVLGAAVLLVLMHLKHQLESAAVQDRPYWHGFIKSRVTIASFSETAGAVACLALLMSEQPAWYAALALVAGIGFEHLLLMDALIREQEVRDLRLPRWVQTGEPRRRRGIVTREGFRVGLQLWAGSHLSWLWWIGSRIPPLRLFNNALIINQFGYAMAPRPGALSTQRPYTTWDTLTDRTYSARHLPPVLQNDLPDLLGLRTLFSRGSAGTIDSEKSTLLFSHFAQWFVDGFLRTDPGNVLKNTSEHDIDLSQLYGQDEAVTRALRSHVGGRLKSQWIGGFEYPPYYLDEHLRPKPEFRALQLSYPGVPSTDPKVQPGALPVDLQRSLFALGIPRGNIHYGFAMISTLFLREHNRVAELIEREHHGDPAWDDDRVFEATRNTLIVLLLKVVIADYINHISPFHHKLFLEPGTGTREEWFRQNWMAVEFNLLYRWHSLVPSSVRVGTHTQPSENVLWDMRLVTRHGLGFLFDEASRQPAGEIGLFNSADFLLDRELMAVAIGRSAELAPYNDYREACGYRRMRSFADISSRREVQDALARTYGSVDQIELVVGLLAEDTFPKAALPALMGTMVGVDAFSQALTNPLLAKNVFNAQTFSAAGMRAIRETRTLAQVVHRNITDERVDPPLVSFTRVRRRRGKDRLAAADQPPVPGRASASDNGRPGPGAHPPAERFGLSLDGDPPVPAGERP